MPFIPDFIPAVGDIDAFIKVCFRDRHFDHIYEPAVFLRVMSELNSCSQNGNMAAVSFQI